MPLWLMLLIISMLVLFSAVACVYYFQKKLHSIRIFGFDLLKLSAIVLCIVIAAAVLHPYLPARGAIRPEAYENADLNVIAGEQLQRGGIAFDADSFTIQDIVSENFFEALLCVYQANGRECASLLSFDRDLMGNLAHPQIYELRRDASAPEYLGMDDGIFGHYLVAAGWQGTAVPVQDDRFRVIAVSPNHYYLYATLTQKPWIRWLLQFLMVFAMVLVGSLLRQRKGLQRYRKPAKFYERWHQGQPAMRMDISADMENDNHESK